MPEWFTANYARCTTAPRRDGLWPRGCWLVLLQSEKLLPQIKDFAQVLYNRFFGREQGLYTEEAILEGFNF